MATRMLLIVLAGLVGLTGCATLGELAGARSPVTPLMKADGWRDELGPMLPPFAVVEIAYDRPTAEQAWAENAPDGLPERSGDPVEPGIYGNFDDIDFATQVVVVWSSGQSSSCPGWLADIDVDETGTVHLERADTAGRFGACTDDYNPYRMLLAVDRDRVPGPDALPTEDTSGVPEGPGALVSAYPATD